ncbi:hypothetical protein CALVIDRAFT_603630, partial [Calocera viscosa TUFC12733]
MGQRIPPATLEEQENHYWRTAASFAMNPSPSGWNMIKNNPKYKLAQNLSALVLAFIEDNKRDELVYMPGRFLRVLSQTAGHALKAYLDTLTPQADGALVAQMADLSVVGKDGAQAEQSEREVQLAREHEGVLVANQQLAERIEELESENAQLVVRAETCLDELERVRQAHAAEIKEARSLE